MHLKEKFFYTWMVYKNKYIQKKKILLLGPRANLSKVERRNPFSRSLHWENSFFTTQNFLGSKCGVHPFGGLFPPFFFDGSDDA